MRFPPYTCVLLVVLPGKQTKQEVYRDWWEGFFSEDVDFVPIEMNVMERVSLRKQMRSMALETACRQNRDTTEKMYSLQQVLQWQITFFIYVGIIYLNGQALGKYAFSSMFSILHISKNQSSVEGDLPMNHILSCNYKLLSIMMSFQTPAKARDEL